MWALPLLPARMIAERHRATIPPLPAPATQRILVEAPIISKSHFQLTAAVQKNNHITDETPTVEIRWAVDLVSLDRLPSRTITISQVLLEREDSNVVFTTG